LNRGVIAVADKGRHRYPMPVKVNSDYAVRRHTWSVERAGQKSPYRILALCKGEWTLKGCNVQ
jgi:hypothetical protein